MRSNLIGLAKFSSLIVPFCERDIIQRYRGSALGLGWSLLQPLAMLGVYTFVFSVVFKAKWGDSLVPEQNSIYFFALNLFAGLLVVNLFGESLSRSPDLVANNANYVKKVIFPVEILSISVVSSATANAMAGMFILFIGTWMVMGFSPNFLWLPWIWLPLVLFSLGTSWLISALGVYIRDLSSVVSLLLSVLLFVTPVFYPITALPLKWQAILSLNPLAAIVEQTRAVIINQVAPNPIYLFVAPVLAWIFAELSLRTFLRCKHGFADVL